MNCNSSEIENRTLLERAEPNPEFGGENPPLVLILLLELEVPRATHLLLGPALSEAMIATVELLSASVLASSSCSSTKAVNIRRFTPFSSAPYGHNLLLRVPLTYFSKTGRMVSRKSSGIKATTLQEKEEKLGVEDYFHVKTIPNIVEEPTDGDSLPTKAPGGLEKWVIRFEQSVNVLLTDSVIKLLDLFYSDRHYARFFVLETIARVPYFAFISVLHMYESFGWWRRADYLKVHFAESWNELHHLLIMEELGGNAFWFDRFIAQHIAIIYYFMTVFMYALSPRMAYHLSECVERHAYSTYDKFIKFHGEELKKEPAPQVALDYYMNEDLYLFDEFQTSRAPNSRRPKIENLYDVFLNVRDDEGEHCKTMKACQTHGNLRSPHSNASRPHDVECAVPTAECEGFVDCFKKSLTDRR